VLRTDLPSHRRSSERELVEALRRREPLALAEVCSRTLPVAFAVGRRLLPPTTLEPLLLAVFEELWAGPPTDAPVERWVRARTTELGLADLRERDAAPAVPSALAIAPDLRPPSLSYLDTTERTLEALDPTDRVVLLRAHDEGVPTAEQDVDDAGRRLLRALRALADPDQPTAEDDVEADGALGDLVLGLLDPEAAAALDAEVGGDPVRGARVQILRRGRRRIEGLPPTPDLGPRIVAAVLAGLPTERSSDPAAALPADAAPGAEDDTGEIDVVAVRHSGPVGGDPSAAEPPAARPATGEPPAASDDGDASGSALGPLDPSEPAAAGDLVVGDVAGQAPPEAAASALGPAPELGAGEGDSEGTMRLPSALVDALSDDDAQGDDPYAPLRADGADRTDPATSGGEDPYAALRDPVDEETATAGAAHDPDDPFADLREPGSDEAFDDAEVEPRRRSPLVRLLQILGILVLIAGGIGVGLLLGQIASSALRG
jgi:hypothetical protein